MDVIGFSATVEGLRAHVGRSTNSWVEQSLKKTRFLEKKSEKMAKSEKAEKMAKSEKAKKMAEGEKAGMMAEGEIADQNIRIHWSAIFFKTFSNTWTERKI